MSSAVARTGPILFLLDGLLRAICLPREGALMRASRGLRFPALGDRFWAIEFWAMNPKTVGIVIFGMCISFCAIFLTLSYLAEGPPPRDRELGRSPGWRPPSIDGRQTRSQPARITPGSSPGAAREKGQPYSLERVLGQYRSGCFLPGNPADCPVAEGPSPPDGRAQEKPRQHAGRSGQ